MVRYILKIKSFEVLYLKKKKKQKIPCSDPFNRKLPGRAASRYLGNWIVRSDLKLIRIHIPFQFPLFEKWKPWDVTFLLLISFWGSDLPPFWQRPAHHLWIRRAMPFSFHFPVLCLVQLAQNPISLILFKLNFARVKPHTANRETIRNQCGRCGFGGHFFFLSLSEAPSACDLTLKVDLLFLVSKYEVWIIQNALFWSYTRKRSLVLHK